MQAQNPPAALANFKLEPNVSGELFPVFKHPGGRVTSYDLHYTSAPKEGTGAVGDTEAASGTNPAAGWVADRFIKSWVSGLVDGMEYRFRMRARNAYGPGPWAYATGTPQARMPAKPPTGLRIPRPWESVRLKWWQPTALFPAGYHIHYTSAPKTGSGAVGDMDAASGADPAKSWVNARPRGTGSQVVGEGGFSFHPHVLTHGTKYRFRVRAVYGQRTGVWRNLRTPVASDWAFVSTVVGAGVELLAGPRPICYDYPGPACDRPIRVYEEPPARFPTLRINRSAPIGFSLSHAVSYAVSVDYATSSDLSWTGTAATAGMDYTAVSGTVTFAPGETHKTIYVPILDDNHEDSHEGFVVKFSNPSPLPEVRLASTKAWVIILNHDTGPPPPKFLPASGATVTDAAGDITLTFAGPIRKNSTGTEFEDGDLSSILTLKTDDKNGSAIGFTASINAEKTVITIDPSSDLPDGQVYVAVSDAYYDASSNRQGSATNATFTVNATGPAAPTFLPASGATVTDAAGDITLTFAEAIRKDSAGTGLGDGDLSSILTLKADDENGSAIDFTASINAEKTVITINPSSDLPDGQVYVAVSDAYYDAAGNQGSAANATFTVDATGPAAPTFLPASGATVTDKAGDITLTFAEAILKDSAGTGFEDGDLSSILTLKADDENGAGIGFTASINDEKTVITIDPSSDLSDGRVYVAVSDAYYDAAGNQGSAANATFTVDETGPAAPTFLPASGATVTDAAGDITLTFTEPIRKDSAGAGFEDGDLSSILALKVDDENGSAIAFTASIDAANKVITIDPSSDLSDGQVYVAVSDAYYDAAGNRGSAANATFTVTRPAAPVAVAVSLSATPNPVSEGSPVTVRATLATALAEAVTIPLTVTRGTSEDGDHGSLASITIPVGGTSATGTVSTSEDDDGDDETFTVALGSLPSGLSAGAASSVEVTITDSGAQQQVATPLTAAFANVPSGHDGTAFTFDLTLSDTPGAGNLPVAASFKVAPGTASVSGSGTQYTVTVTPKQANAWKDVTITLAGGRTCSEAGAVCTADGRALSNTSSVTVGGPVRIRIAGARAKEGKDESLDFAVTLNRAAAHDVSVDYATADETAAAGADYTATSGTLTFAAGETAKTVSVPLLDDAIDEGREVMRLLLSNPQGAFLRGMHRKAKGVIVNDDPLQAMWLARFGRMVASDAVASVTARLETPRDVGSHLTVAGQRLDLSGEGDSQVIADAMTGLARAFGAHETPTADSDDPFVRHGFTDGRDDPVMAPARRVTGRELLLGSSFRAVLGNDAGSQWTSWGQGASVSRFSASVPGLELNGESATGSMGMDYERGPLLFGFATTHSVGEGTAQDEGWRYELGSTATMAMPYARLALTDRLSAWGLAGTGTGRLSLDLDGRVAQSYRTDLAMTLAATGVRGELVRPAEAGGFALALKADAFWVRAESERVTATEFGNLAAARGDSSRVRAVLDGSRTFSLASGAALTPSLEIGVRHDAGDAETGTGMELGAGLGYADPSRGLDMALRAHGLAAHAEEGYGEWGVSGTLRLVPDASGRGLSMSLTPSWGADPGGSERLWMLEDAQALAANDNAPPSSRFDADLGYGIALFGDSFTGTPNVGFGMSDAAREYRLGWRMNTGAGSARDFEVNLDLTRREDDDGEEHGIGLRATTRW